MLFKRFRRQVNYRMDLEVGISGKEETDSTPV